MALAVDGKTLRGARTGDDPAPRLLACLDQASGAVCAQVAVDDTVKGNQPGLHRQLRSLPWKDIPAGHVQAGRAHGRIEKRTIKVVTVTAGLAFPHAAQAIQITRRARRHGARKWRTETSYAITSLPASQAQPAQLADWIRGHWKIENQLHWVRDVTFGEDPSAARTGTGPHVVASIRNLVISILRLAGHTSIARVLRHTARNPARAFRLLTEASSGQ